MDKEYDPEYGDLFDQRPWECPTPNIGLSLSLKNHDYNGFMKTFEAEVREIYNTTYTEKITITCEGQCPKGCEKKFKLKLGKSITKRSFEKIYKHGIKHPLHCMTTKYDGVIKHG